MTPFEALLKPLGLVDRYLDAFLMTGIRFEVLRVAGLGDANVVDGFLFGHSPSLRRALHASKRGYVSKRVLRCCPESSTHGLYVCIPSQVGGGFSASKSRKLEGEHPTTPKQPLIFHPLTATTPNRRVMGCYPLPIPRG